ncbi:DgyrCDS2050 [Dimorphilus gyrociliatus]|uniref:DgyrCDS2050 n=1 Tax=Dimorphilus gyrociliatus TaxID=2664684 RepID=A0A7I8V9B3_9ANNE|nr:DgyrCDS2050 [Dimorphilus gyrociliatus]
MASQLVVPPSKHTLFIRGFASSVEVDDVRKYFEKETGFLPTVEFFRESENREYLFLALRFESKSLAKEVLERYDQGEILGYRVSIKYFRDMRKARQKAKEMFEKGLGPNPKEMTNFDLAGNARDAGETGTYGRNMVTNSNYRRSHYDYSSSRSKSSSYSSPSSSSDSEKSKSTMEKKIKKKKSKRKHSRSKFSDKSSDGCETKKDKSDFFSIEQGQGVNKHSTENNFYRGYSSNDHVKLLHKEDKDKVTFSNIDQLNLQKTNTIRTKQDVAAMDIEQTLNEEGETFGMSSTKLAMVKQKKEEIEQSYKQDCETFAAVVKMLISKDHSLEDKLQQSLRDNLKDIGQRCIHELKEYIENLKPE